MIRTEGKLKESISGHKDESNSATHTLGAAFQGFCRQNAAKTKFIYRNKSGFPQHAKPALDIESTVSSTLEESVRAQESEAYPGFPVQEYCDGLKEEIDLHFVP